jgi:hypothetical protein
MPPQQCQRLLDLVGHDLMFRTHVRLLVSFERDIGFGAARYAEPADQ